MEEDALQSSIKYLSGERKRQRKLHFVLLLIREPGQYDLQTLNPSHFNFFCIRDCGPHHGRKIKSVVGTTLHNIHQNLALLQVTIM